ncbi:MAG: hypothetical protein AAFW69_02770 [Pseudomonadota bacterium]
MGAEPDRGLSAPRRRRLRELAGLLPVAGLLALLPPLVGLFAEPVRARGVPLILLYVFGVWIALIVGTRMLARRLAAEEEEDGGVGP